MTAISVFTVDKAGRRVLLMVALIGLSGSLAVLGIVVSTHTYTHTHTRTHTDCMH